MKQDVVKFLFDFFSKKKNGLDYSMADFEKIDYLSSGLIDSFGVIELVCEIEAEFNVKFSPQVFQDDNFRTVGGLSEIVENLRR